MTAPTCTRCGWEDCVCPSKRRAESVLSDQSPPDGTLSALSALSAQGKEGEPEAWPTLDPVAYHGLADDVVTRLAERSEADPAGLLATFLAAFGCAAGRIPHAQAGGARHPAKLYILLVGETSRARKGTAWRQTRSILRAADHDWVEARVTGGLATGEGLVKDLEGGELADKRLLVVEEEFARVLAVCAREGATLSTILRQLWDDDRVAVKTRKDPLSAEDTHVSVVSHITLEELRRSLTTTEQGNGFANRFAFVCVQRTQLLPEGGGLTDSEVDVLGARVRRVLQSTYEVGLLRRTPPAKELWGDLYKRMALDAPAGLVGAVTARAEAQCLRMSVAYALLDGSPYIDLPHVEAAWALWRYCEQSAKFIFGDSLGDPVADGLLRAIREAGPAGLDGTQQRDLFSRHVPAARLESARALLEGRGLIISVKEETGGRPRTVSYAKEHKWIHPS